VPEPRLQRPLTPCRILLDLQPRISIGMKGSGMIAAPARTTSADGWLGPEEQAKSGAERVLL
jgi:hypothetical protein